MFLLKNTIKQQQQNLGHVQNGDGGPSLSTEDGVLTLSISHTTGSPDLYT